MTKTTLMLLVSALAVSVAANAADAKSKQRKRAAAPAPQQWNMPGFQQQPARMIEVKPGLWISSYGCITDEGYGRYGSCDASDNSH